MKEGIERTQMFYAEPVYRPPSEAHSLLIQATVGCSSAAAGRCYFCNSTLFHRTVHGKQFRVRPIEEILHDIHLGAEQYGRNVEKIFLLDSNALIMKTHDLLRVLTACYAAFPGLRQVSCYGCCEDILRKTDGELQALCDAGLTLVFVGLESGDQEVLDLVNKGVRVQDQIDAVVKANVNGLQTSVTVILGLGGRRLSKQHAMNTGMAVSAMNPSYLAALTLMLVPGTVLYDMECRGEFEQLKGQDEFLEELEIMLKNTYAPGPVVFRTNHASNYLPLKGILPGNQKSMLEMIGYYRGNPHLLRSESTRGL